jgi:hypothetical protein
MIITRSVPRRNMPRTAILLLGLLVAPAAQAEAGTRTGRWIGTVLREPLPAEELTLSTNAGEWVITGPTFTYRIQKSTGTINGLRVVSNGQEVIASSSPIQLQIDDYRLASELTSGEASVVRTGKDRILLRARGILRDPAQRGPEVDYALLHTFFNDGVVVLSVKLTPRKDLLVGESLAFQLQARGQLSHWIHKRRDEHGGDAARGRLPEPGNALRLASLTSCLQVFSPNAALAVFTDGGATHLSPANLDTAVIEVVGKEGPQTRVSLCQYLVRVAPGDPPFRLKAGETFSFRVGTSVAPNRLAHPRLHDLRMFAWIGDTKYPYPTDEEISEVAKAGFTLFQMHRLGTPGEPRPPAGELERVIKKVHESGMLFLWTENADLMYDRAPGVQAMKAKGQWPLWQGFNYGGRYQASMDPYCDLAATCLASPNGLAEYRLATYARMTERFRVDGMYVDDNLGYGNCTLWREHGHPRQVYDCLIELHEMNWRRREFLRSQCPHLVLVSHNTRAIILPVVCDFDALLYGEGYSFSSLEDYWDYYRPANAVPAQGMIWPGGEDPVRCAAALAYNYDLLTGGGQYCQIDWRLFPKKFPYGAGVTEAERLYVQTYNLSQYYFGLYESEAHYFANSSEHFDTSAPLTYATVYRNRVWEDWLMAVANMGEVSTNTSLQIRALDPLGLDAHRRYALFDARRRTLRELEGRELNEALGEIRVAGRNLRLFWLRRLPTEGAYHVWGGKRLSEEWHRETQKLTLVVQGPAGLEETLILGCATGNIERVEMGGKPAPFFFDAARKLAHGPVTFGSQPVKIEVQCSAAGPGRLLNQAVPAAPLGEGY